MYKRKGDAVGAERLRRLEGDSSRARDEGMIDLG